MRIDEKLNLIIPVPRDGGRTIYVHAAPLSREAFEANYLVLSKTFALIMAEGLTVISGPRVALYALRDVAKQMKIWDGPEGVERSLVAEIVRMANVAVVTDHGWQAVPLHNAVADGLFTEDEKAEVLGAITFFIVNSAMHKKDILRKILESLNDLWGTQTSSLGLMEYVASLPSLTPAANTGAPPASTHLVPS